MTSVPDVETCRRSDAQLSARFVEEAVPLLGRLRAGAIRLTGNPVDGDDLLQETSLRAWAAFGSFTEGTNLGAWLNRILVNVFINDYASGHVSRAACRSTRPPMRTGVLSSTGTWWARRPRQRPSAV